MGLRAHASAGSLSLAKKAAEGRALERWCQLELGVQRAAAADRDGAVANVRRSQEDLQATRREVETAEPVVQSEATLRRRVEKYAEAGASQAAATRTDTLQTFDKLERALRGVERRAQPESVARLR